MNKADANVLYEVAELMRKCPAMSPNPYEIAGTVNACRDFQTINKLVAAIIDKYTEYSLFKNRIGDPDFDGEEYVLMAKETYEKKLAELRNFIKRRESEGWK
jgi:hypothetical protein